MKIKSLPTAAMLLLLTTYLSCESLMDPALVEGRVHEVIDDSLLLRLPFDRNGVDIANSSHLTILKECELVPNRLGEDSSAISLNGTSSFVSIINPIPRSPEDFSISFWIKNLSLTSEGAFVLSLQRPARIYVYLDVYTLRASLNFSSIPFNNESPITLSEDLTPNQWHHVVIRYKKYEHCELFVDNILVDRNTALEYGRFFDPQDGYPSSIGCVDFGTHEDLFWKGCLDDLRIYEKHLSDLEVEYLFEN